jgi:hypothetical protein
MLIVCSILVGEFDAFIIFNKDDAIAKQFLVRKLQPWFEEKGKKCLTPTEYVPGVSEMKNLDNALSLCKIVIILVTPQLTQDSKCMSNIEAVMTHDINRVKNGVVPILLEDNNELPSEIQALSGIKYDESKPDCDYLLNKQLQCALGFQEFGRDHGGDYGSSSSEQVEEQLNHGCDEISVSSTISDSATGCSPRSTQEHTTPQNSISLNPRPYLLDIMKFYRSSWCRNMRTLLLMNPGIRPATIRILLFSLILISCFHRVNLLPRALAMVVAASEFCQFLANVQLPCSNERLEFDEQSMRLIRKHLIGENQIEAKVQNPDDVFNSLRSFLTSVVLVNVLAAWFHSASIIVLLWLLGHYDGGIYQGSTWLSYMNILVDAISLLVMQGCFRTLIGAYHYERTLLVGAHQIGLESQSDGFRQQIRQTAIFLQERNHAWNLKALRAGSAIALVSMVILAAARYSHNYSVSILAEGKTFYLIGFLFVHEALLNCPKRHMKITAVLIDALAICALVSLKWTGDWKIQNYPDFEKSLALFLPFIEIRMLCFMSAFQLILHLLTSLQIRNWPLPTLEIGHNWIKKAITMPLVVLLVGTALY